MDEEELMDALDRLFAQFDMETGYPSGHILTADGPVWGMVPDELQIILDDLWKFRHGDEDNGQS